MNGPDSLGLPLATTIAAVSQPSLVNGTASANSGAIYTVECEDNVERLCKSNEVHPNVPACEWVAYQLARQAGFSVIESVIVTWKGTMYFGSTYFVPGSRVILTDPTANPATRRVVNAPAVWYEAISFDAWLLNPDRHSDNVLFVQKPDGSIMGYLIDHDKAMMGHADDFAVDRLETFTANPVNNWVDHASAWIHPDCNFLDILTDWNKVEVTIARIRTIPVDTIRATVAQVPDQWISDACRLALAEFLIVRQQRLGEIVSRRRALFTHLGVTP